ncbi:MAG TPA: glycine--tRNA ligase [Balneola sp.]|jgi:glycyl-tRNA synthetase|nr:glycine--tRNA ligase [Bacteroidota bacterium]MAC06224.1 glycine--tRNA ligase [Balneola sp.]MAO77212.1 glycine--tRNA ligase [Balneola sp.]MBF62977.1 glycine--tRNA ligase [Balneola sp.]HAH52143.1 glycine--tRNA ligase [Balneola sp.]|tara:strand:- start:15596 stop:17047 length:1452 start_codon:yes stop_codon:yes gene_type:complete
MSNLDSLDKIVSLAKARGFIFQSSEIYGGLSAVYDYGPLGVELKNNIRNTWWKEMTQRHDNIVGIDAAIFMHPKVWEASGHVGGFNDPMIDDKQSKKRYRADMLIEQYIAKLEKDGKQDEADKIQEQLDTTGTRKSLTEDLYDIIMENEIRSPDSGAFDWTEVRQFNLMFKTQFGSTSTEEDGVYLRPETAQGIFVNYKNVLDTARVQVPFGIAQTGKAFRNEVVARQFVFRMREFEQMEMQYFVEPGTDGDAYEEWLEKRLAWHKSIGIREENLRTAPHPEDKLAHYARAAADIQYKYPIGWQEVEGIHNRSDFDLTQHQEFSGKKLEYYDQKNQKRYMPYVIETSVGLDRLTLMVLCDAYREEEVEGDSRTVLKLDPRLAPVQVGVFPLIKKPELQEIAHKIEKELREDYSVQYDESGSIGKRYRRLDEAGTPFCITVDFDTIEKDNQVTIRYRDDMSQVRIPIEKVGEVIQKGIKDWKVS